MIERIQMEICCGSLTDVRTASLFDEVDRIELNCSLELGGITPSLQTLLLSKKISQKKILCMVRPRGAGFFYNNDETAVMYYDAKTFLENGADGIVFGFLNQDHTIDQDKTKKMVDLIHSYKKDAVFHKAYDNTPDPHTAMETLIALGVDRVLTAGQASSTEDGILLLNHLVKRYGKEIQILPGGGVTKDNVVKILQKTGCNQFHMTAKTIMEDQGEYFAVSGDNIREVINTLSASLSYQKVLTREDTEMFRNDSYEDKMSHYEEDDRD